MKIRPTFLIVGARSLSSVSKWSPVQRSAQVHTRILLSSLPLMKQPTCLTVSDIAAREAVAQFSNKGSIKAVKSKDVKRDTNLATMTGQPLIMQNLLSAYPKLTLMLVAALLLASPFIWKILRRTIETFTKRFSMTLNWSGSASRQLAAQLTSLKPLTMERLAPSFQESPGNLIGIGVMAKAKHSRVSLQESSLQQARTKQSKI